MLIALRARPVGEQRGAVAPAPARDLACRRGSERAVYQLAAVVTAEGQPASLEIVTLDERLAAAARREGFAVGAIDQAT